MTSIKDHRNIKISITYLKNQDKQNSAAEVADKMCDHVCNTKHRFLCTLCLNETDIEGHPDANDKHILKGCSYCQNKDLVKYKSEDPKSKRNVKDEDTQGNGNKKKDHNSGKNERKNSNRICKTCEKLCKSNDVIVNNAENSLEKKIADAKASLSSGIDLGNGLNLLNEVLNVFKNKKVISHEDHFKDASVGTEGYIQFAHKTKNKLSMSHIVKYSIQGDEAWDHRPKFVILECRQPLLNNLHVNLKKHKSSSVPQMKLEELKHSLKEKTKSKDAIEEVNRMFAVVRQYDNNREEADANRPMIRLGPRVLPVVKPKSPAQHETRDNFSEVTPRAPCCQHCQTAERHLSGGDTCFRDNRCEDERRCEKCVYMVSCGAAGAGRRGDCRAEACGHPGAQVCGAPVCRRKGQNGAVNLCECCKSRLTNDDALDCSFHF